MGASRTFSTTRRRETTLAVGAGFLIVLVSVLALLLAPVEGPRFGWGSLLPAAIFLGMGYVVFASAMKLFIRFRVERDALVILLPPFHRRRIPRDAIAAVEILDARGTRKVFERSVGEQFAFGAGADAGGYARHVARESPAYRYLSIAPRVSAERVGARELPTSVGVDPGDRLVILRLADGALLYLAPADVEGFVEALGLLGAPAPSAPAPDPLDAR